MIPPYNKRVEALRESPTRAINRVVEQMRKKGLDVIMLSAGEPGVPPPREVRLWLAKALEEESMRLYSYTPSPGFMDLREAIAMDMKELEGVEVSPDQILVVTGGQNAIFSSFAAILEPGDEVIIMDPTYFGYLNILPYFGVKLVPIVSPAETAYQPDVEGIKEAVKRGKTKAIVLVSPDNPTGRLIREDVARAIAEIAQDHGIWIVYDEPYKTLIYEGSHVSFFKLAPENTISLYAFSKDPGIPGWRLGYVYGPAEIVRRIALVSEATTYNPPSVAQYLVLTYLRNREVRRRHIEYFRGVYAYRRDLMVEELRKIEGISFYKPQGSMFVLVDAKEVLARKGLTVSAFADKLLREKHVAVVPGEFFGNSTVWSVRLSFTRESPERIREGVARFGDLLSQT
ncbi:MAG: aminotransferase class I/II-fold pyridoxal phosphate-dependent enzyme [Acidilobaceae archaeon]|nr:aminotransferase class I/II-fold pyridoxal phosphate-dependent enzyme [Acidilobaceae archaeon]MCX8165900.1 aminotransferase class I/II-fold pyridoxal phosphate-dependent enzyme [Acidilobaceae archaeon]MDW7974542.1 aminotransferase class I/II-fold pyridoxal phosphate-dependent enzyme [Sulfolobales archaeon]